MAVRVADMRRARDDAPRNRRAQHEPEEMRMLDDGDLSVSDVELANVRAAAARDPAHPARIPQTRVLRSPHPRL
jgi:hypothetical protein